MAPLPPEVLWRSLRTVAVVIEADRAGGVTLPFTRPA